MKRSTKISIPHPLENDCAIVGILEQVSPEQPTRGRKIALVRELVPFDGCKLKRCRTNTDASWVAGVRMSTFILHMYITQADIRIDTRTTCFIRNLRFAFPLTLFDSISGMSFKVLDFSKITDALM